MKELFWMTWLIQPEGKMMRMEKYWKNSWKDFTCEEISIDQFCPISLDKIATLLAMLAPGTTFWQ